MRGTANGGLEVRGSGFLPFGAQDHVSLGQPEEAGCSDADGADERVSAAALVGVDTAPILEIAEPVLDPVKLTVAGGVVRDGRLAVGP